MARWMLMPSFLYRVLWIQGCVNPLPILVGTDVHYVVVSGIFYEEELPLSFRRLVHFDSHPERHHAIAFSVRD